MTANEHPDVLFEHMFAVKRQYAHRGNGPNSVRPTMPQLIACVVNGASRDYTVALTRELLSLRGETDEYDIVEKLKEVANEIHTALYKKKDAGSSTLMD